MSLCSSISIDLMIISTWLALVSKEVNLIEILLNELQAVRLIPPLREDIKRNLTTNGKGQVLVSELLLESINEISSNVVFFVVSLEFVSFFSRAVSADWTDINHACSVFNESSSKRYVNNLWYTS